MSPSIVAVLTEPAAVDPCLDAAAAAAAVAPDRPVEAFHPRVAAETLILPGEEVMTARRHDELAALLDAQSRAVRRRVEAWRSARAAGVPDAVWHEQQGDTIAAAVAARAAAAELLVLMRPAEAAGAAALHAAIFDSRRLLLLVPPGHTAAFGAHLAIAWKAGEPALRAVAAALPWLARAKRVSLLSVGGQADLALPAELRARLDRAGVTPEPVAIAPGDDGIGPALLREAHASGADCLVLGAYRHNRLLELVLGGVTQHMLHAADLPLLMMH